MTWLGPFDEVALCLPRCTLSEFRTRFRRQAVRA
jgi:hypothetical protein